MGLDINLNTSKIDISEEDGLNVDLYNDNIDISDDEADDIIIEITGLKSINKFIGLEDTPLYYDNGKFFKVEDNKIIYTDIQWKDISGDISEAPEIIKIISDLVNEVASDVIDERINLHNLNEQAHPFIQNIIQENYNTLDTKINNTKEELSEALNTEITNRETADNELSESIQQETLARIEADTTLQNNINSVASDLSDEINARESADTTLSNSISDLSDGLIQEITDRQTADTGLQSQITSNYNTLDSKIDSVEGALADSITALDNKYDNITSGLDDKIDDVDDTLTTHISDNSNPHNVTKTQIGLGNVDNTSDLNKPISTATQTALDGKVPNTRTVNNKPLSSDIVLDYSDVNALPDTTTINDLTTTAQQNALNSGIDSTLTQQITTNQNNISNLSSTVSSNYTTLDNRITSEVNTLNGSISDEETARINADNGLQSQIDAITSASDVTDIVGTYAELQAYDTTELPDKSIIKVLQDESRNDETTYYRWVITNNVGAWVLIGEEGPYYTKSEADGKFIPQTRTVNGKALSTNITLDASDVGALPSSTVIPTTDQTFDGTSTNAQSGIAIAGAKFLQNTATGNSSITVDGTATAKSQAINIGTGSQVTGNYGTALGAYAFGNASHALGLGNYAKAMADYAIQLNKGTNNTSNSLYVGFNNDNYQLLDGTTGLIPDARISTNIARTSQIPSAVTESTVSGWGFTKNIGTVTSVNNTQPDANGNVTIPTGGTVDQTFDGTSTNAQSGVAIEGELTTHYVKSSAEDTSQGITSSIGYLNGIYPTMQMTQGNYQFIITTGEGASLGAIDNTTNSTVVLGVAPNGVGILQGTQQALLTLSSNNNLVVNNNELATQDWVGGQGFITSADLPTNYVTTDTAQTITARKTFIGEKAIYFKQDATTNKLGFTLYNPSDTELGAFEYRPNTIDGNALLNINTSYSNACYVGFRYWGKAVNIVAPKVATAGNYFIPTHITDGTNTVTASNNGTLNISSLLPDVSNFVTNSRLATTLADYQPLLVSGTNIKTINNNSILGDGNLTLDGLPSQTGQAGKFLTTNGIDASWAETTKVTIRDWSIT